jgi:hypothetical protein
MGFVNIENNKFKITFTEEGLDAMLGNGLLYSISSFSLWDDNILYTIDRPDQPVPDITGNRNNYTTIKNDLRNPLKNG